MPKKETFILIMPSYNEEKRIEKTVNSWVEIVKKFPRSEILIIDGDSNDQTRDKIKTLSKKYNFVKLIHKPREGYGKDLIFGYKLALESRHKWIFQTDADGHFESTDFYKLWNKRQSSSFIVGRRFKRRDSKYRLILASLIELWITILFNKRIKDSNIPFRLIRRSYLKEILHKVPPSTIAPNIFLTILAARDGHKLHHIPVKHRARHSDLNKTRIFKGALKGFIELMIFALLKI